MKFPHLKKKISAYLKEEDAHVATSTATRAAIKMTIIFGLMPLGPGLGASPIGLAAGGGGGKGGGGGGGDIEHTSNFIPGIDSFDSAPDRPVHNVINYGADKVALENLNSYVKSVFNANQGNTPKNMQIEGKTVMSVHSNHANFVPDEGKK